VAPAITGEGSGGTDTGSALSTAVDASAPTISIRSDLVTERESSGVSGDGVTESSKGWFGRLVDRLKGS
jgi:hypothetical protein